MDNEYNDPCGPFPFVRNLIPDPVYERNVLNHTRKKKKPIQKPKSTTKIEPSLEIRGAYPQVDEPCPPICYCDPNSRPKTKSKKLKSASTTDLPSRILRLPSPMDIRVIDYIPRFKSPELIGPTVRPRRPSVISQPWLESPQLDLKKPKSGIIIQDDSSKTGTILDSLSLGYDRPYAIDLIKKYGIFDELSLGFESEEFAKIPEPEELDDVDIEIELDSGPKPPSTVAVQIQTEPEVVQKEETPSEVSTIEPPEYISKWVQTFGRDSEQKYKTPAVFFKRKTLESHSFTNIKYSNRVVKEYCYGIQLGNYHEGDAHFSPRTRNKQTLANLVVAYCFSFLKHPSSWSADDIDNILEVGDNLYTQTLDFLHFHKQEEIKPSELLTNFEFNDKRFVFHISEPLITGLSRSDDKTVYNFHKAFTIFFHKYNCALLETKSLQLIIWKTRFYYVFDSKPRANDLYTDPTGAAAIMSFFDIKTIVSMLIERTPMGNWPFRLSKVLVIKILDVSAPYDTGDSLTSGFTEANQYHILSDERAVLSASFSMADPCFDWTSNRQALAMSVVALIYAKITPSAAWTRKILDKVLIFGNMLFYEIAIEKNKETIELEDIPSIFTLGPYKVVIAILGSVIKGFMFSRKKYPSLVKGICDFFENSTSGIIQFDRFTYAIWKQRDFYYLFDPFPRDFEGFMKRNGTAILSMHNSVDALIVTIMKNIDPDNNCVFSIHALKEVKICWGGDDLRPKKIDYPSDKQRATKNIPVSQLKPICLDPDSKAEESFVPNTVPSESDVSVGSSIQSLGSEYVPPLKHVDHQKPSATPVVRVVSKESIGVVDLDSPSLSDTQLASAPRPEPHKSELSIISDNVYSIASLMSWLAPGEGEDEDYAGDLYLQMYDFEKKMLDELEMRWWYEEDYFEMTQEFEFEEFYIPRRAISATTMTDGFRLLRKRPLRLAPLPESLFVKRKPLIQPPPPTENRQTTLSEELLKDTNFIPLPDGSEIICGTQSIINNNDANKISLLAPFVSIMATVVSHKYAFVSWDSSILDYILLCGYGLQNVTPERFDEAAVHEFRRIALGSTDFTAKSTYLLDFKSSYMEKILNVLFRMNSNAIIVNRNYSCAVFYKNYLYYLYDPYNCNAVGLGQGDGTPGTCCFMRFTSCHKLVARILYNKAKREGAVDCENNRYIVSIVEVHRLPPGDEEAIEEPPIDQEKIDIESCLKRTRIEQRQTLGYQLSDNEWVILGTDFLKGRNTVAQGCIKQCHFVCLSALLLLFYHPINTWSPKLIDKSLEVGRNIFSHAKHKEEVEKRIVNNVFLEDKFFDLTISQLEYPQTISDHKTAAYFDFYLTVKKHNFLLLQFPSMCTALYIGKHYYHFFDPYRYKNLSAHWIRFKNRDDCIRYIETHIGGANCCRYYTFTVTRIRKAREKLTIQKQLATCERSQAKFKECIDIKRPFNESEKWLQRDPIPWSRLELKNAKGQRRGEPKTVWKEWDIEYPNDLWSLWGNLHQKSKCFIKETRGKQTICNCIVCCIIISIYDFSEWNAILLDSILKDGNQYYVLCVREMSDEAKRGEFNVEHLKPEVSVPPFTAHITVTPILEGTMFALAAQQFNLYRALVYFFKDVERRFGLIFSNQGGDEYRRILAFGKVRENEYFMYDCQSYGPPLFLDKQGCSYILRMTSLYRLIYAITVTLRNGDFCIYDVQVTDLKDTARG